MVGSLLAQPGTIGTLRLKNRLIMAPMGNNFGSSDGLSTERDRHYYALRAEGGVAAIVTEAMAVSEGGRAHNNSLWIYHDRFIPGLARLVTAIKAHDCLTIGQLNHRGALLRRMVLNMEPVGPSPGATRTPATRCGRWTAPRSWRSKRTSSPRRAGCGRRATTRWNCTRPMAICSTSS